MYLCCSAKGFESSSKIFWVVLLTTKDSSSTENTLEKNLCPIGAVTTGAPIANVPQN